MSRLDKPLQTLPHEDAVVFLQGHQVRHGRQRHQIQNRPQIELVPLARGFQKCVAKLEDEPSGAEVVILRSQLGIHQGIAWGGVPDLMMVDNQDVDSRRLRPFHLRPAVGAAVEHDEESRFGTRVQTPLQTLRRQTISLLFAVRNKVPDLPGPQRLQKEPEHAGAGDAIHIVVGVNNHRTPGLEVPLQQRHRRRHPGNLFRRRQSRQFRAEKLLALSGSNQATAV